MASSTKRGSRKMVEVTLKDVHDLLGKLRDEQRRERDQMESRLIQAVRQELQGMRDSLTLHKNEISVDVSKHEFLLAGDGDTKPGLINRVRDHDRYFRLIAWLGGPLLISVLSGLLGLIWALLIGKVELVIH